LLARYSYASTFLSSHPQDRRDIIWVDEFGVNLHLRRRFGRARRGEHATVIVPNSRGRNISVCAAMSEEGLIYDTIRPGAYNAVAYCEFLTGLFEKLQERGRTNCWIVMDNVRFHHCSIVITTISCYGHTPVFLPPYSPMLNPIESLFSKWKTLIRTTGILMTVDQLLEAMAAARIEISVSDCLGWIRDVDRNIGLSLQQHIFQ